MKKYIVLLLILITSLMLCGCSNKTKHLSDLETILKRGYIIIGVKSDSPPFGYLEGANRKGIDIEIAKEIASEIFKEAPEGHIHYENVDAQNRISKLNSKEVDILIATVSINEKRKLVIDFSKPYFTASTKLLTKKNSTILNLQYFNSKGRLAVIMGTTGEKTARQIAPNASLIGAKTYTEAFNYLQNNEVDAILGDDIILSQFKGDNYKILNKAYSRENYAVAVRKTEDSKELLNEINIVISTILDSKKFKILKAEQ